MSGTRETSTWTQRSYRDLMKSSDPIQVTLHEAIVGRQFKGIQSHSSLKTLSIGEHKLWLRNYHSSGINKIMSEAISPPGRFSKPGSLNYQQGFQQSMALFQMLQEIPLWNHKLHRITSLKYIIPFWDGLEGRADVMSWHLYEWLLIAAKILLEVIWRIRYTRRKYRTHPPETTCSHISSYKTGLMLH